MRLPPWSIPALSFSLTLAIFAGTRAVDEPHAPESRDETRPVSAAERASPRAAQHAAALVVPVAHAPNTETVSSGRIAAAVAADPAFLEAIGQRLDDPDVATQAQAAALLDEFLDVAEGQQRSNLRD
jgi:hypothetical protein